MHFTQEDYIKIENWLHRNSVKDTEFQEALPFTGKEIVTVVQDGHNRKVNIQEFINQLYKHGVEDFLNVTNTYRANNITLKEAIRLIPAEARKEGQVITFLNTDGNWEIYQFIGKLNQWNNPTLWNNPFDWEKLIVDSILPDEEDLTKSAPDANGNAYLSLKDRKYEPDKYSGLGRKILRKRVVEIEDPIYGTQEKNLLLQADFAEDNTVYVVRYDFTLNGQDITLPDNSYIEYEGGSISDGNIIDRAGGLNRVVLKKNIINGKSTLTQEMLSTSNTIYEIRYDFDLNGKEITIHENCILDFKGGCLCNGILRGNNTAITANISTIFRNIELEGLWNTDTAYPEWFGAKGDGINDDREAIQRTLDNFTHVKLTNKYRLNSYTDTDNKICIVVPSLRILEGNRDIYDTSVDMITLGEQVSPKIIIGVHKLTHIKYIAINGGITDFENSEKTSGIGTAINVKESMSKWSQRITIEHCNVNFCYYGYNIQTFLSNISRNYATGCFIGFYIHGDLDSNEIPTSGGWGTTITLHGNFANYCKQNGYRIVGIMYSKYFSNACDNTGNYNNNFYPCYYLRFWRSSSFEDNGCETAYHALHDENSQFCSISKFTIIPHPKVGDIYNEDNNYFISIKDNLSSEYDCIYITSSPTSFNTNGRIQITHNVKTASITLSNIYFGTSKINSSFIRYSDYYGLHNVNIVYTDDYFRQDTFPEVGLFNNKGVPYSIKEDNNRVNYWDGNKWITSDGDVSESTNYQHLRAIDSNGNYVKVTKDSIIQAPKKIGIPNETWMRFAKIKNTNYYSAIITITNGYQYDIPMFVMMSINRGAISIIKSNNSIWNRIVKIRISDYSDGRWLELYSSGAGGNDYYINITNSTNIDYDFSVPPEEEVTVVKEKTIDLKGPSTKLPSNLGSDDAGETFFNTSTNKWMIWDGIRWLNIITLQDNYKTYGNWNEKPSDPNIGYQYLCLDKSSSEGGTSGLIIYYRGSNIWVDALGRVVS